MTKQAISFVIKTMIPALTALALAGCSGQPNHRQYGQSADSVSPEQEQGRYRNWFAKVVYPKNCQADCYQPSAQLRCQNPDAAEQCEFIGEHPPLNLNTGFQVQWLGHASFYIHTPTGEQVLFDPVFGQFDWPINWGFHLLTGHSRGEPARLTAEQLKDVDAVAYSHLHYDHFNKADIAQIGATPQYFVHRGSAEYLPELGLSVHEQTWFSQAQIGSTTITAMPGNHFNSRVLVPFVYNDHNQALWGGWLLQSAGFSLFFAGDTGYSPHFAEIAKRVGTIDVCLLPIASYQASNPEHHYRPVHMTPEDALVAAKELGCKVMVPWGYGNASWQMGDLSSHSALQRLLTVYDRTQDVPLWIFNEGEQVTF